MLSFLGGEAIALGVIWWIVGLGALLGVLVTLVRSKRNGTGEAASTVDDRLSISQTGLIYLLSLWGVLWCACLAASVLGETEVNWMVPGYIGLVVLIAARVDRVLVARWTAPHRIHRRLVRFGHCGRCGPSFGVVLSRDRALGSSPDQALGSAVSALRADRAAARAPGGGSSGR